MATRSKPRLVLVHWKEGAELAERADRLRRLGYVVDAMFREGGEPYRRMKDDPPHAVVIDLSRLPSHGRHLGVAIRDRKSTAHLPIVFVDGVTDKVDRVRAEVPDSVFCTWRGVRGAIARAVKIAEKAARTKEGQTPRRRSATSGYSGTPLPKKLGIREGTKLALLGAPKGFDTVLGTLPADVTVKRAARGSHDVLVLFCPRSSTLESRLDGALRCMADGASLWIAWPKKSSDITSDLDGDAVRARGLETGLVDTKVCAIDTTWSGLRFQRRRRR